MLASLHAKGHSADELRDQLAAATPAVINLELITMLPSDERRPTFDQLPTQDQQQVAGELARRRKKREVHTVHDVAASMIGC